LNSPVGTLLNGRYRLDAQIGAGGMSMVYRAFDTVLERTVAIKLMHRDIAADSDQLERFRREARAVAQLNHPHIVTVIDAGEDDGTQFIVFEYVEGETLKERIRRCQRLPIPEAVAYAIEVARALECAHERSIVHRDVKPQNVLVDSEGSAKITDFGIARTLTEEGLTADGRVLGTTDYVSPEQALGRPVTGQSDLYSLGIVLYEMLTGSVPFTGENQVAVAMRHVREEVPDVQRIRPEISSALAAIVDRATAKNLNKRYPDAATMLRDLEDALAIETARAGQATGEATTVIRTLRGSARRRVPLRMRNPGQVIVWLVVVAVLVAGGIYLIARNTHSGTSAPPNVHAPPRTAAIHLGQGSAHDYDPLGDHSEHPSEVKLVVDGDPNTYWTTESYVNGNLAKAGVGLYLDAAPQAVATKLEIQTPTPGFDVQVYVANSGPPATFPDVGWKRVGAATAVRDGQQITLDTAAQPFRYYLVWITKLPPGKDNAAISELTLFGPA
jgi:tRNA A-37 threonylcarbamoyl transferase component Bud32